MLNLIVGEKSSGKTQKIHDILAQGVKQNKSAILIVPKHFTFETDKGILHTLGPKDASEVQVLSFARLADTVLKTYGGLKKPVLPMGAKTVYMALAIRNVKDSIEVFKKQKNEIALVDMMLKVTDEMKSEKIDAAELREICDDIEDNILREKLEGIALVSQAYDALVERSYFDSTKLMDKIHEILLNKDFFDNKIIAIDGFYKFSKQELDLISLMCKRAKEVHISLLSDNVLDPSQLSPFFVANQSAKTLIYQAKKNGVDVSIVKTDDIKNPSFNELASSIYDLSFKKQSSKLENVHVSSCSTVNKECDVVCATIRKYVYEKKCRYKDFMIVYKSAQVYDESVKHSLAKYDIPIFDDKRQPIANQPLITAIRNVLAICAQGFSSDFVFRYLKTGVTSFTLEQICDLENYVFMWDIDGKDWESEFKDNTRGFASEITESTIEQLSQLNEVRYNLVAPILALKEKLKATTGKTACELIYEFLIDNGIDKSLKEYAISLENLQKFELAKEQEQVWDILMEVFDELAISLDDYQVDAKMFYELFNLVVASKSLGNLPDGFDQVLICDAQRAVIKKAKYVFIVGVNEGVFPSDSVSEGFLKDSEKAKLNLIMQDRGLEISKRAVDEAYEQRFIIHSLFCSASEELNLTFSTVGSAGEKKNPSTIIKRLFSLYPSLKLESYGYNDDMKTLEKLVVNKKSCFEAFSRNYGETSESQQLYQKYFEDSSEYKDKIECINRAVSKKDVRFNDSALSKTLFKEKMLLSASRVEDYNKCHFMYFCKFGVGAKPRRKAKFDPMQSGTLVHWVLEKMLKLYKNKSFLEKSDEELKQKIEMLLDEYITLYMGGMKNKDARFAYLYSRLQKTLEDIFLRLKIEFESSEFSPWKYELEIGEKGEVKPFKVQLDDGFVELGGIVDRVDIMEKEDKRYIRVVDYKTGSKEFELCEVLHGLNMQMLLYLVAIWRSEEEKYKDMIPSAILYFPARSEPYSAIRGEKDEKKLDNRLKANCKMNGMILNDMDVIKGMDTTGEYKLIPIKLAGKAQKIKGNFITLQQLGMLSEKMDKIIYEMGQGLHDGDVRTLPVRIGACDKVCAFCDYSSVCLSAKDSESREVKKISHDKVIEEFLTKEEQEDE